MQENNPYFGWILQENPNFWEDNGYKKINSLNYHYYGCNIAKANKYPVYRKHLYICHDMEDYSMVEVFPCGDLEKIMEEGFVSAELLIKFAAKKTDDSQKYLGAVLKPIADTDNIEIKTNTGGLIKGSTLQKTKDVEISTTESNMVSETELSQAMESFLKEL